MSDPRWLDRRSGNKRELSESRSDYMRDECRVVHAFSFRRMQGKTQVLGPEQGDFHRNRLTHSIEVASIARGIVKNLRSRYEVSYFYEDLKKLQLFEHDYDYLISAICLLHDIGHPPFGHAGEEALNFKMRNNQGFEANAQTLRIVTKLERYTERDGLDLTRRVLLGLVKYPAPYSKMLINVKNDGLIRNREIQMGQWRPPKCYYNEDIDIMRWLTAIFSEKDRDEFSKFEYSEKEKINKTNYKTFDCAIMDLADDIAYSVHDLEDAIFLGLIDTDDLENTIDPSFINESYKGQNFFVDFTSKNDVHKRKMAFSHIVKKLINEIKIEHNDKFENLLSKYKIRFDDDALGAVDKIKDLIKKNTYGSQEIQTILFGGMMTIMQLFDVLISNPDKLLPNEYAQHLSPDPEVNKHRIVCDYISGMTDEFARRLHDRIYGNSPGSLFEKL